MNRARLITYEQVRSEIQAYIEARRSQFAFKTVSTKSISDPMEVDSFGKGGKKGKRGKKGKGDGKRSKNEGQHQNHNPNPSNDVVCWQSKGKPKNVTGKGAGSLEQGEQAAVVEPQPQRALASSPNLASIETLVRSPHPDDEVWLRWTYDTGAAISAFPLDARIGTETKAHDCSYKLISDRGGLPVQGTTEYGFGVTFQGRKADVHKNLISASKVHNGGYIITCNSILARKTQQFVQKEIVNEPGAIRLYPENGTYIEYTKILQHVSTSETTAGGASATLSGSKSEGKAYSCLPAQSPETKLQITSIEDEIVDEDIDDEAFEVQRPNVVVVGRGPTKREVEHHVASCIWTFPESNLV